MRLSLSALVSDQRPIPVYVYYSEIKSTSTARPLKQCTLLSRTRLSFVHGASFPGMKCFRFLG